MKKLLKYTAIMALLPFFASSCVDTLEDAEVPVKQETVTLTLHSPVTKSVLSEDRYVLWEEGDEIIINNINYPLVLDENNPDIAYIKDVQMADRYIAAYPWAWYSEADNFLQIEIPRIQEYREGSFGQYANMSIAYSTTTELHFRNIASIIKLGVKGDNVNLKSLSISGNNGEYMAGYYILTQEEFEHPENIESLGAVGDNSNLNAVDVNLGEGIQLSQTAKYIYAVVPAQTFEKGITVTLSDSEGRVCVQSTSKSFTTKRSEIFSMADFTFSETSALGVSGIEKGISSVSYNISGQANSSVRTLLVYKSMWDYYYNVNEEYNADPNRLATDILSVYGRTVQIGSDGTYSTTQDTAWNRNGNETAMTADTDYKLLVSYADGINSLGKVLVTDIRTLPAQGVAPSIELTTGNSNWDTIDLFIGASEDVTSLLFYHTSKSMYDSLVNEGKSDREILLYVGWNLNSSILEAAKSGGYRETITADVNNECVMLVMALNSSGMETITKSIYTTEAYTILHGNWTVVSENAKITGGFMSAWGAEDDVTNLTVQKLENKDWFRVVNLPLVLNNMYGSIFVLTESPHYYYIDASDHNNVIIRAEISKMQMTFEQDGTNIIDFCSAVSKYPDLSREDYPLGTYSESDGIINFGTVYSFIGDSAYLFGNCALHLHAE